jgi:methyltransferase (TIGR00027 family)
MKSFEGHVRPDRRPFDDPLKAAVGRRLGRLPERVRYVPVDLTRDTAAAALERAGFDRAAPTLVVWEGVSLYLPMAAVEQTFAFAGALARGSRLVFTHLREGVLHERAYARFVRVFRWQTGFDPATLARTLARFSLELLDDVGRTEYVHRYLLPMNRSLPVFDIERVAVTGVAGGPAYPD